MNPEILAAIDNLTNALRKGAPEQMVAFTLFVNCESTEIDTKLRTPEQLKSAGISMRNIRGQFIK